MFVGVLRREDDHTQVKPLTPGASSFQCINSTADVSAVSGDTIIFDYPGCHFCMIARKFMGSSQVLVEAPCVLALGLVLKGF